MKKKKNYKKDGCNEDCFNCPYPDCYKPASKMKHNDDFFVSKAKLNGESQARMYTLELGGNGGPVPNQKKKFLF